MARLKKYKPKPSQYKPYVLNRDESRRFLAAAEDEPNFGAAFVALLALAMREGEILGLRRSALNNSGQIEIRAHLDRLPRSLRPSKDDDGFVIVERAKWGSERTPTLPDVAKKWLRRQAVRQTERRVAAGTR